MCSYILSIDQGTTSSRAIIFDHDGQIVASSQREHQQIFPQAGWVEHDPMEIWVNVREVMGEALSRAQLTRHDIAGIGITNQRETAIIWNKKTGEPIYNALVWQDTRTQDVVDAMEASHGSDHFRATTGLPLTTYFLPAGLWLLDNVEAHVVRRRPARAVNSAISRTGCPPRHHLDQHQPRPHTDIQQIL